MKTINLHVHTNLSDGKYSPMEVVKMANENLLDILALTDHNVMVSDEEFEELKHEFKGECLIRGCEVSVADTMPGTYEEKELHYVCLFMEAVFAFHIWQSRCICKDIQAHFIGGTAAGSDFHGFVDGDVLDSCHPYSIYERMMERWRKYYF